MVNYREIFLLVLGSVISMHINGSYPGASSLTRANTVRYAAPVSPSIKVSFGDKCVDACAHVRVNATDNRTQLPFILKDPSKCH